MGFLGGGGEGEGEKERKGRVSYLRQVFFVQHYFGDD